MWTAHLQGACLNLWPPQNGGMLETSYCVCSRWKLPLLSVCGQKSSRGILWRKSCCSVGKFVQEVVWLVNYPWLKFCMRKKDDGEIRLFQLLVSGLPCTLRYIHEYVCELLGSVILSACLVWGFVATFGIILLVHQYGEFKISVAIPK